MLYRALSNFIKSNKCSNTQLQIFFSCFHTVAMTVNNGVVIALFKFLSINNVAFYFAHSL